MLCLATRASKILPNLARAVRQVLFQLVIGSVWYRQSVTPPPLMDPTPLNFALKHSGTERYSKVARQSAPSPGHGHQPRPLIVYRGTTVKGSRAVTI